jgi:hypothetical protein
VHRVSLNPFEFGTDPRESHTGTHGFIEAYIVSPFTVGPFQYLYYESVLC